MSDRQPEDRNAERDQDNPSSSDELHPVAAGVVGVFTAAGVFLWWMCLAG